MESGDSDEWREERCLELNKSEKSGADHFRICISQGGSQGCQHRDLQEECVMSWLGVEEEEEESLLC